jgi:xanthine dehydrogenase molybdopterin-binding subunit B
VKSALMKFISRVLIISTMTLSFHAQAGMIATERAADAAAQFDRDAVVRMLDRPEVASQLQAMGLSSTAAHERLAAMNDEEVRSLAGKINALPAGADMGWGWVLLVAVGIWAFFSWRR